MADIELLFGSEKTQVVVRNGVLSEVGTLLASLPGVRGTEKILVVTDRSVGAIYGDRVIQSLDSAGFSVFKHEIAVGESSKCLERAAEIYQTLANAGLARDGIVLALGGGVVSDLAGFVAATWMRGVRFAICPTTLEADIDASIGGKTGINLPGGKNLVGAFHQPIFVTIDPNCLKTLDSRDIRAGLAESVKHALIASSEFLDWHEENAESILSLDEGTLIELIERNVKIKAEVVERDPNEERDVRMILNLGHTIGHAIETCTAYSLRHGECVGLGLLAACRLSHLLGMIDATLVKRVERLLGRFSLPVHVPPSIDREQIRDVIRRDKKIRDGRLSFVLLEGLGQPVVRSDVEEQLVVDAYESLVK